MPQASITITGLAKLVKVLPGSPPIHSPALRHALERIVTDGAAMARSRAPVGKTGTLKGSIVADVSNARVPRNAVLKLDPGPRGHAFMLDAGSRRGTAYQRSRGGGPTKGWLRHVRDEMRKRVRAEVAPIVAGIVAEIAKRT